jgi:hypothetical protein
MWHWFSTQRFGNKRISHHFFACYHGHSLADAHAAAIKKILRSEYHQSQLQRFSPVLSEIHWGPASALQFGKLLQKCAKTEYCVIPWIDRDPALKPNPLPLVKIKRQHRFDYEDGKCYAAELSAAALKKLFSFRLR